jgi:putative spermidine/putrescine transport system substrate-binding protein
MTDRIEPKPKRGVTRRRILVGGAAALACPAIWTSVARAETRTLTVRDPGGPYEKAYSEAFYRPFEKETGIKVTGVVAQADPVAQIRSMVETRNYVWDVTLLAMAAHNTVREAGFLEELKIEGSSFDDIPAAYRRSTLLGIDVSTVVIAYRTDTVKRPPETWADVFNVREFPGRRTMRRNPYQTLDVAALAAGVAPNKLYPLDYELAYRKLEEIKPNVSIWWTAGAQQSQLFKSGEVDIGQGWNARVQAAIDEGAPVAIQWNQNLTSVEGFCILKGGPKVEMAREFLKFCAQPKQQALIAPYLAYGPANPKAFQFIDPVRAKVLSTYPDYAEMALVIDDDTWGRDITKQLERFNTWILG